ncbi:hypothetical protein ACFVVO_38515, partial [Streptomyces sp. NPDC058145]
MADSTHREVESVWDYPRPPAVLPDDRLVRVECGGHVLAETRHSVRVLETSHLILFVDTPAFRWGRKRNSCGAGQGAGFRPRGETP